MCGSMHDRRRVLRVPLAHRLLEHLLGVRLDVAVEREEDVAAVAGRALLDRVHGLAGRVAHDRRARPGVPCELACSARARGPRGPCCRCRRSRAPARRPFPAGRRASGPAANVKPVELRASRAPPPSSAAPSARRRRTRGCGRRAAGTAVRSWSPEHLRGDACLAPRVGDLHRVGDRRPSPARRSRAGSPSRS